MFDIIIKNGRVVDGAGGPWYRADIGIKDGRITRIGKINHEANRILDVKEFIIAPGFIDVHSHSDETLLINPKTESYVRQGITTAVNGNCGGSPAPLVGLYKNEYIKRKTRILEEIDINWSSFTEYFNTLDKKGVAINSLCLVGHGNLRVGVMGEDGYSKRRPTPDEIDEMKALLAKSLEDGAAGLSAGLVYPPGVYAETFELVELCKLLPEFDAIFAIHIRGQGDQFLDAVREAINIVEESGAPVLLSHHSPNPGMWGKTEISLRLIDEARARGSDITIDKHGYIYGSTGLSTILPPWAHEGGIAKLIDRLNDPETRERLKLDIAGGLEWPRVSPALHARAADWDKITITSSKNTEYIGQTIKTIADEKGKDPFDTVFGLLIDSDGIVGVKYPAYSEEDLTRVFKHHTSMIATDGSATAPYGILGKEKPHPKSYGTFPMIFRKYVRDFGILTMEEAVKKMTSQAAHRFSIWDRGLLLPGMFADIVVFDPQRITDRATIDDPVQYPIGIKYVIVNGIIVLEDEVHTGKLPGKALRHIVPNS